VFVQIGIQELYAAGDHRRFVGGEYSKGLSKPYRTGGSAKELARHHCYTVPVPASESGATMPEEAVLKPCQTTIKIMSLCG
jgi:hypothetical protein